MCQWFSVSTDAAGESGSCSFPIIYSLRKASLHCKQASATDRNSRAGQCGEGLGGSLASTEQYAHNSSSRPQINLQVSLWSISRITARADLTIKMGSMAGNVESNPSPVGAYRKHLPDLNQPRFQVMAKQSAHEYADDFKTNGNPYWLFGLYQYWLELLQEPFRGVTTNGKCQLQCAVSEPSPLTPIRQSQTRPIQVTGRRHTDQRHRLQDRKVSRAAQ